jgi:hypothetical protein
MERGGRRRGEGTGGHNSEARPKTGAASVPGKSTLVEAAYPTLARALRSDGAAPGGPTMDDAATAAVENKGSGAPVDPSVATSWCTRPSKPPRRGTQPLAGSRSATSQQPQRTWLMAVR